MAYYAKKWTKTGSSVDGWPTGTDRWQIYQDMSCDEARTYFLSLPSWTDRVNGSVANLVTAGYTLGDSRDCSGTPTPPDTSGDTVTSMLGANYTLLTLQIQESGGKYRLVHTNAPSSGTYMYILSGQPAISALPTTYDYEPGDEVTVTFIKNQTTAANFYDIPADATIKAEQTIRFGSD